MIEAVLGAVIGAVVGASASWGITAWQLRWESKRRIRDAQFDLVLRIVRQKDGPQLAAALNEVPVLFAHDSRALNLYRAALPSSTKSQVEMSAVSKLLAHLAKAVDLPIDDADLLERGFSAR